MAWSVLEVHGPPPQDGSPPPPVMWVGGRESRMIGFRRLSLSFSSVLRSPSPLWCGWVVGRAESFVFIMFFKCFQIPHHVVWTEKAKSLFSVMFLMYFHIRPPCGVGGWVGEQNYWFSLCFSCVLKRWPLLDKRFSPEPPWF